MANRYESPLKSQYMQTYVEQYVPLPLEVMQNAADNAQKHYDDVANKINQYQTSLQKLKTHTGKPTEEMEVILNNYQTQLDEIMNSGDLRLAENKVTQLGRVLGDDYRAGELAKYVRAGKQEAEFFKLQQEQRNKKVGEGGVSSQKKYLQDRYHERTQKEGFTDELGSILTSKGLTSGSADLDTDAFNIAKQVKANQTDTKAEYQGTFDEIHKFASTKRKGVKYDEVEKITAAALMNNSDDYDELRVRAMYDKAMATGVDITEVEVTQDDIYAEALEASRAAANAYSYSETDIQDYFQKSTGFSSAEENLKTPLTPNLKVPSVMIVKRDMDLKGKFNSFGNLFRSSYLNSLQDGKRVTLQQSNKTWSNFTKGLQGNGKAIIGKSGNNYSNATPLQLMKGIATGDIDIPSSITGQDAKNLRESASNSYKSMYKIDKVKKEVTQEVRDKFSKTDLDEMDNFNSYLKKQLPENASQQAFEEIKNNMVDPSDEEIKQHLFVNKVKDISGINSLSYTKDDPRNPNNKINIPYFNYDSQSKLEGIAVGNIDKLTTILKNNNKSLTDTEARKKAKEITDEAIKFANSKNIISNFDDAIDKYDKVSSISKNYEKQIDEGLSARAEQVLSFEKSTRPDIVLNLNGRMLDPSNSKDASLIQKFTEQSVKEDEEALKKGFFNSIVGTDEIGNEATLVSVRNEIAEKLEASENNTIKFNENIGYSRNPKAGEYFRAISVTGTTEDGKSFQKEIHIPESKAKIEGYGGLEVENQSIQHDAKRQLSNWRDEYGNQGTPLGVEFPWIEAYGYGGLELDSQQGTGMDEAIEGGRLVFRKDGASNTLNLTPQEINGFTARMIILDREIKSGKLSLDSGKKWFNELLNSYGGI